MIRPRNLTGMLWMDGIDLFERSSMKGDVWTQRPFIKTIERDLSGRNSMPAHFITIIDCHLYRKLIAIHREGQTRHVEHQHQST